MEATVAGRYRCIARVGVGGIAEVFRAEVTRSHQIVAVKMARPEWVHHRRVLSHFRNEASALRRLRGGPVPRLHGAGETRDGASYLVLEWLEGCSLEQWLARKDLPLRHSLAIFARFLDALDSVHRRGIVHADLKSTNVMAVAGDVWPRLVLIDFGLAGPPGHAVENGKRLVPGGTPEFMAPELIEGGPLTFETDIYAAGVMLYTLLTGAPPFEGDSADEIAAAHLRDDVVPPSLRATVELPPSLDGIVRRALARNPHQRFASAAEMAHAVMTAAHACPSDFILPRRGATDGDATARVRLSPTHASV